jgi:polyisoprenoid-binding protein YceI
MKAFNLATFAAVLVFSASSLMGQTFKVDPSHSEIGFKVKHLMISNVKGNFSKFSGSYELDKGKLTSLVGEVEVATIDTGIEKRDNHLRSEDFFYAKKYPKMTFKMTKFSGDSVTGELTIRGVTKTLSFDAELSGTVKDPWGNVRSAMTLEGKINRMDYGLQWNKALEAGGVVVGDTVKMEIELEGIAQ